MSGSRVTIVVVTHNSADVLGDCLASIELHGASSRAVVVDNASHDNSVDVARAAVFTTVISTDQNEGFSKANNRALEGIETEYALILNPDARLTESTLPQLLAACSRHPEGVALGPKTVYPDGRPQVSFGPDLTLWSEYRQRKLVNGVKAGNAAALEKFRQASLVERPVDWVSGSCMLLKLSAAREVGVFDERYFLYEEDADLCLRLRKKGGSVLFVPGAVVIHGLGTSMAKATSLARNAYDDSHRLYYRLHKSAFQSMALQALLAATRIARRVGS